MDWSSDLCSSDLAGGAGLCGVRSAAGSGFGTAVSASRPAASGLAAGIGTGSAGLSIVAIGATAAGSVDLDVEVSRATVWRICDDSSDGAASPMPWMKIGRAACRERGGQYV